MSVNLKKNLKVMNPLGLHARPASIFVRIANKFDSDIYLQKDGQSVNGKSIMGVLMLAAEQGSEVLVEAVGPDAAKALEELERFLSNTTEPVEGEGIV